MNEGGSSSFRYFANKCKLRNIQTEQNIQTTSNELRNDIYIVGSVHLLRDDQEKSSWQELCTGTLSYVADSKSKEITLFIDSKSTNNNLCFSQNGWRYTLNGNVIVSKEHPNFVIFITEDNIFYGINFCIEREANDFFNKVDRILKDWKMFRQTVCADIQNFTESATQINAHSDDMMKTVNATNNLSSIPDRSLNDSRKVKKDSTDIISPIISAIDSTFLSLRNHLPNLTSFERTSKRKKWKTNDIGVPTNFEHKAHFGSYYFNNSDDPEVEKIVRDICNYFEVDMEKMDKEELDSIRKQISIHGPNNVRLSMKIARKKLSWKNELAKSDMEVQKNCLIDDIARSNTKSLEVENRVQKIEKTTFPRKNLQKIKEMAEAFHSKFNKAEYESDASESISNEKSETIDELSLINEEYNTQELSVMHERIKQPGRTELMESIRQSDKRFLSKVNRESINGKKVKNNQQEQMNILESIRNVLEKRREVIALSSDEESDNEKCDSEWDD